VRPGGAAHVGGRQRRGHERSVSAWWMLDGAAPVSRVTGPGHLRLGVVDQPNPARALASHPGHREVPPIEQFRLAETDPATIELEAAAPDTTRTGASRSSAGVTQRADQLRGDLRPGGQVAGWRDRRGALSGRGREHRAPRRARRLPRPPPPGRRHPAGSHAGAQALPHLVLRRRRRRSLARSTAPGNLVPRHELPGRHAFKGRQVQVSVVDGTVGVVCEAGGRPARRWGRTRSPAILDIWRWWMQELARRRSRLSRREACATLTTARGAGT
jgi:hypothetical protein